MGLPQGPTIQKYTDVCREIFINSLSEMSKCQSLLLVHCSFFLRYLGKRISMAISLTWKLKSLLYIDIYRIRMCIYIYRYIRPMYAYVRAKFQGIYYQNMAVYVTNVPSF